MEYSDSQKEYFTVEYEERKRARSPSIRRRDRHERRDHSPRHDYEIGRGRGRRDFSPEYRGSRRYPSHDK